MICQWYDVFASFAKGRDDDREDIEPVEEIFPEALFGNFLSQVFVAGSDDPEIDL